MTTAAELKGQMLQRGYTLNDYNTAIASFKKGGTEALKSTVRGMPKPSTIPSPDKPVPIVPQGSVVPVRGAETPVVTGQITPTGAYNPYTGGVETVTPTVGVNTSQYSMENKQALWGKSGLQGPADMNAFYRKEDGTLGIKPEYVKTTDTSTLTDANTVNAYLGGIQNNKYLSSGGKETSTDYVDLAKNLTASMTKSKQPETFSTEQTLNELRTKYGVSDLESQLAGYDKQIADIQAENQARVNAEKDKPVAMGVIGGRVSQIERQQQERLDAANRGRAYVTAQLQTKNAMIDMTMKAKAEDYQMANARYDAEFNKNLQMINLARSVDQQAQTEQEKQIDNARATVATIYNTITSGGIDPTTMTESQKAQIARMEMQAGFPAGFVQQLYDKNPKGDIVYTGKDTLADGNEWVTIVTKDKTTGELSTNKILVGRAKKAGGTGVSTATKEAKALEANKVKVGDALAKDASELIQKKVNSDTIATYEDAENIMYTKYAPALQNMGYTQEQTKNIISGSLARYPKGDEKTGPTFPNNLKTTSAIPSMLANPNK